MKRLQLEDLSKQLGFSKTLISMVLNGKGNQYGISQKTQALVLEAVSRLNYTPNKFAKALRTGKSYFIGLIVTDISNPFYSTIAKSIESVLFENRYNLLVCNSEENEEKEKLLVDTMLNQISVDGLIVASTFKNASFYEEPRFSKVPIVFIDRILPLFNTNYVVIDNYGGSLEIINNLIGKGCKKIACFSITPSYISTIEDRINGYKDAIQKNKLKQDDALIKLINFDFIDRDVENSFRELVANYGDLDAVFVLNNHIAVALLKILKLKEFKKYSSINIGCFDDIELFNIIDRPVISVSQPVTEIGYNSSHLLLDIIAGKQTNKSNIVLSTKLINR